MGITEFFRNAVIEMTNLSGTARYISVEHSCYLHATVADVINLCRSYVSINSNVLICINV